MNKPRVGALLACLTLSTPASAELNCNVGVEFHPAGGLRACVLNGHHRLYTLHGEAVTCADGKRAEQHLDGSLARCTLSRPARLEGQECPRGAEVRFTTAGALERCVRPSAG